jgi:NAD(P)-dependent dehydrogenase (short-subunit alcohol dehydrogenase family)
MTDRPITLSTPPMKHVEGKIAFITGGDSGIGLGIARAFVDAGMQVVITYRSETHLEEAMTLLESGGTRIHAVNVDVTDRNSMAAAAEETIRVFGKVHVLVNNAGVGGGPLSSASFNEWDWCLNVNVTGVFNGIHAFLPYIKAHGEGGQIVATSSIHGLVAGFPFMALYMTTKFAVVGMVEGLRSELASTNIGVSVFCPGRVNTNIVKRNRTPVTLIRTSDPDTVAAQQVYARAHQQIMDSNNGSPGMDPLEAGERVLQGIRDNDLFILSHPEYEQAILERNEALIASFRKAMKPPSAGRVALERLFHTSIYSRELYRK